MHKYWFEFIAILFCWAHRFCLQLYTILGQKVLTFNYINLPSRLWLWILRRANSDWFWTIVWLILTRSDFSSSRFVYDKSFGSSNTLRPRILVLALHDWFERFIVYRASEFLRQILKWLISSRSRTKHIFICSIILVGIFVNSHSITLFMADCFHAHW